MAEVISKLKCLRPECGHEWYPRTGKLPKVCPKCKHYDWNKSPWEVDNVKEGSNSKEVTKEE